MCLQSFLTWNSSQHFKKSFLTWTSLKSIGQLFYRLSLNLFLFFFFSSGFLMIRFSLYICWQNYHWSDVISSSLHFIKSYVMLVYCSFDNVGLLMRLKLGSMLLMRDNSRCQLWLMSYFDTRKKKQLLKNFQILWDQRRSTNLKQI